MSVTGPERAPNREDFLAALIHRIAHGESEALACLYDCTNSALYALAIRTVGDSADAEEIALDVYRHVWQSADSWDPGRGSVLAWLLIMTRSRCLDRVRNRESRRRAEEPARQQPIVGEMNPEVWDRAQRVRQALSQLPPEQRQLIELAWFDGLSQTELAEQTGAPLGTVKTRIRLGMARLRNLLQELHS